MPLLPNILSVGKTQDNQTTEQQSYIYSSHIFVHDDESSGNTFRTGIVTTGNDFSPNCSSKFPTSSKSDAKLAIPTVRGVPSRTVWPISQLSSASLSLPIPSVQKAAKSSFTLQIPIAPAQSASSTSRKFDLDHDSQSAKPGSKSQNLHVRRGKTKNRRDKQRRLLSVRAQVSRKHEGILAVPKSSLPCTQLDHKLSQRAAPRVSCRDLSYFPSSSRATRNIGTKRGSTAWNHETWENFGENLESNALPIRVIQDGKTSSRNTTRRADDAFHNSCLDVEAPMAAIKNILMARKAILLQVGGEKSQPTVAETTRPEHDTSPQTAILESLASVEECNLEESSCAMYLITDEDVNIVEDLVLKLLNTTTVSFPSSINKSLEYLGKETVRTPAITDQGLIVGTGMPTKSELSKAEVQPCLESWFAMANFYAHTTTPTATSPALSPKRTTNDIITKASPPDCELVAEPNLPKNILEPSRHDGSSGSKHQSTEQHTLHTNTTPSTSCSSSLQGLATKTNTAPSDVAREKAPTGTETTINNGRYLINACDIIVEALQTPNIAATPRTSRSRVSVADVLSFPPLPARNSADWQIPLPPIESPVFPTSQSVDEAGLGTSFSLSTTSLGFLSARTSWIRTAESSAQLSRKTSFAFSPDYEIKIKSPSSVVPPSDHSDHCSSDKIVSELLAVGSGLSPVQHVTTIDHRRKEKLSREWMPARPPSVYPTTLSSSSSDRISSMSRIVVPNTSTITPPSQQTLSSTRSLTPPSPRSPWLERSEFEFHHPRTQQYGETQGTASSADICDDCVLNSYA